MVTTCAGMVPFATGFWFATTVTVKVCVALVLLGSVAFTVMVAGPAATGVMVTVAPDTLTVALLTAEEVAV